MRKSFVFAAGRRKKTGLTEHRNRMGYLFVLPFILGLALIFVPTIFYSIQYTFSNVQVELGRVSTLFVGFENFRQALFVNIDYRQILVTALRAMLLDMVIILLFSFFIANILNQRFFYRPFARLIFFLPAILATGIVSAADSGSMLSSMFQSSSNTGDSIATAFGGGMSSFFDLQGLIMSVQISPQITDVIVYAINNTYTIVNASGIQILIFLSALQSISPSIFEAAKVEGATKWEEFWKITFPMLTPMILVNIVYTVVDSFANPRYGTLAYIQKQAFEMNRIGLASAMSWLYFILVLIILGVTWLMVARRIHYLD